MNIPEFYFHTKYTRVQGEQYTKISVRTEYGVFAVILNKKTKDRQRQAYTNKKPAARVVYCGTTANGLYKGFSGLARDWEHLEDIEKTHLSLCWNMLLSSLYLLGSKGIDDGTTTQAQFAEVRDWCKPYFCCTLTEVLQKVHDHAADAPQDAFATSATPEVAVATTTEPLATVQTDEWGKVPVFDLSPDDLNKILDIVNQAGNPAEGIEYNGNRYRVTKSETGYMELKYKAGAPAATPAARIADTVIASAPVAEPAKPKRRTMRMVEIINGEGLTEFVKGSLYALLSNANMGGTPFYKVANDNGEERYIRCDRARQVEVFAEPPEAAATNAQ